MCQKWKSSIAPTRSHQIPSTKLIQLVPYGTAQRFPLLFCADFFCKKTDNWNISLQLILWKCD
jgi:hypothetical protein